MVNKNVVVRSKSYNVPMLTPVVEYDADASAGGGASCVRRHSVSEMTSCLEETASLVESTSSAAESGSTSSLVKHSPASTTSGGCSGERKSAAHRCLHLKSGWNVFNTLLILFTQTP